VLASDEKFDARVTQQFLRSLNPDSVELVKA
jgi:hypothetical protein